MAQIGIVRIGSEHFREYTIEPGDNLSSICLRFGHRDWRAVYNHVINQPFRIHFPDPSQISYINSVNLFIPLQGAHISGKSALGRPIDDYIVIRITDSAKIPIVHKKFWLRISQTSSSQPSYYESIMTDENGEIIKQIPLLEDWFLTSAEHWLKLADLSTLLPSPIDVNTLIEHSNSQIVPPTEIPLARNAVTNIEAHTTFYIICPMCGRTFMTVKPDSSVTHNFCPNDNFDLTTIEIEIETNQESFVNPLQGQDIKVSSVISRGTSQSRATVIGDVTVYWDESRFVRYDGADYTLWGRKKGNVVTAEIVGRSSWNAVAPLITNPAYRDREWSFQATPKDEKYRMYRNRSIPSNETTELKKVFLWITIHHTNQDAQNSKQTALDLQKYHFEKYADIAYHYVIDADGTIYEGRPLGIKGTHVEFFNGGNIGIVLAGDFQGPWVRPRFVPRYPYADHPYDRDYVIPTDNALTSLFDLVNVLCLRFNIESVWSHRERKNQSQGWLEWTFCPGDELIEHVEDLRTRYKGPPP